MNVLTTVIAHRCSRSQPPCLFSEIAQGLPLQVFLPMTFTANGKFCTACAVTVVIFGVTPKSFFYLLTYLLSGCTNSTEQNNRHIIVYRTAPYQQHRRPNRLCCQRWGFHASCYETFKAISQGELRFALPS